MSPLAQGPQRFSLLQGSNAINIPTPSLDLDFRSTVMPRQDLLQFAQRNSSATDLLYTSTTTGYNTYGNGVPRISVANGLLAEEPRTQFLNNNAAPATQTVTLSAGLYCLWSIGAGSVNAAAGTAVGTGFGNSTQGFPVVFNLSTGGTVVVTVTGQVGVFQLEGGPGPTSFIPTGVAPASRATDYWVYGFNAGMWDYTQGAMMMEFIYFSGGSLQNNNHISGIETAGAGTTLAVFTNNDLTPMQFAVTDTNTINLVGYNNVLTFNTLYKECTSWGAAGQMMTFNGDIPLVAAGQPGSDFDCGGMSVFDLGHSKEGGGGYLRRWRLWNTQLSVAQMRAITS